MLRLSTLRTNCCFGHRNLPEYQHRQNIATFPIILNSCRLFRMSYSALSQKSHLADTSPKPLDLKHTFPNIFESLLIMLDQLFSPVIQPSHSALSQRLCFAIPVQNPTADTAAITDTATAEI